jgi:hypothetical protein
MIADKPGLARLPLRTLEAWHRFVASGNPETLAPLLSEHIVFRSPIVQSPIPGRAATLLVLTTVVQIFENFTYHRTFVYPRRGPGICSQHRQMAAEGYRPRQVRRGRRNDRVRGADPADQGAAGFGGGNRRQDRAATDRNEGHCPRHALSFAFFDLASGDPALARAGALWQGSAACGSLFGPIS